MSEQYTAPDVLARRLDQALPPGKNFIPPVTPDPLVNTAVEIAKLPVPGLTQAASTRIETRLLAAFDQQNPARQPRVMQHSRRTSGIVARWALAACAALVLLFAGLTPSVSAAVPGEPLYTVKQFYERVELATAFTPSAQASVYLLHANRRADEALTLLERNQFDPSLANAVLTNIGEASKSAAEIRKSPRLRGQLYQADLLLTFVVQNAHESGLTTGDEFLRLAQEVEQIGASDLLLPADSPDEGVTVEITPEFLDEAEIAETLEPTPEVTAELTESLTADLPGNSDQPCEHGQSCLSEGVPGGQIIKPTPRPTNVHRDIQPTPRSDPGGGSSGSNGGGNGNGNSNGGGNSGNGSGKWQGE